jgi:hypothetical protein
MASIILGVLVVGGAITAVLLLVVGPALKTETIQAPPMPETAVVHPAPVRPTPPPGFAPPQRPTRPPAAKPGEPGVDVGNLALEIEGEDIDGKKFKLSDYRGKVVLLDFWGNW